MTFYTVDCTKLRYPTKDKARKAIIENWETAHLTNDRLVELGTVFNSEGIKIGKVLFNPTVLKDMSDYLFEDCDTQHVWPMDEDGSLLIDPYRMVCCHPDCADFFIGEVGGPGFKTLKDALKGF